MNSKKVSLKITPDASLRVNSARLLANRTMIADKPIVVLGNDREPQELSSPVVPDARSCFGPRAACLADDGRLIVSDTGHHRLLGWNSLPQSDRQAADWIFGQQFGCEGRNGNSTTSATTLNVPTGICILGSGTSCNGLAVADAWNHRILIWHKIPEHSNVAADVVLGQKDFSCSQANHGKDSPDKDTLHWPYGVYSHGNKLFVADTGNRRVLIWNQIPQSNGEGADLVIGQTTFTNRDENAGADPSAMSMRWPHGMTFWRGYFCVSDAGNNRILLWSGLPTSNGAPSDLVLGQEDPTLVDHNQSLYWPRDNTLNMPYGLTARGDWLIVADTANSRLLGFHAADINSKEASALVGQTDFHEKGDNRWQSPKQDSFCWPYGASCNELSDILAVADSGNNRVSIWKFSHD